MGLGINGNGAGVGRQRHVEDCGPRRRHGRQVIHTDRRCSRSHTAHWYGRAVLTYLRDVGRFQRQQNIPGERSVTQTQPAELPTSSQPTPDVGGGAGGRGERRANAPAYTAVTSRVETTVASNAATCCSVVLELLSENPLVVTKSKYVSITSGWHFLNGV